MPVKVLVLGDAGVGKTSLVGRYVSSRFLPGRGEPFPPLLMQGQAVIRGSLVTLHLWEVSGGREFYQELEPQHMVFANVACCVLVFDVTNPVSLEGLRFWRDEFLRLSGAEQGCFVVIGNKSDLESSSDSTRSQALGLCRSQEMTYYFEASAKTGSNVRVAFEAFLCDLLHPGVFFTLQELENSKLFLTDMGGTLTVLDVEQQDTLFHVRTVLAKRLAVPSGKVQVIFADGQVPSREDDLVPLEKLCGRFALREASPRESHAPTASPAVLTTDTSPGTMAKAIFRGFDSESSGVIRKSSFREALRCLEPRWGQDELDRLFEKAGVICNGMVRYEDFIDFIFACPTDAPQP